MNAGSVFMNHHSKLLGSLFTTFAVLLLASQSVTHLQAEARRVEEFTKTEARRVEEFTKTEARRVEDGAKLLAAQSEAAKEKAVADVYRVLTGAEHKVAVDKAKKVAVDKAKKESWF